jgi:phage repressor protein C with HTH and peptisase S24 domain
MSFEEITIDWWSRKIGAKDDKELSEITGHPLNTIKTWRDRGISDRVKLELIQNELGKSIQQKKAVENIIRIPKLSVTASCGGGSNLESIDTFEENGVMEIDADTLKVTISKGLRSIKVAGYSMVPMLFPDSWVIFDQSGEYKGEGLYVLNWDNTLMVKLLQLTPHGQMRIISANKEYESYTIDRNNDSQLIFYIVGKVVRIIT